MAYEMEGERGESLCLQHKKIDRNKLGMVALKKFYTFSDFG